MVGIQSGGFGGGGGGGRGAKKIKGESEGAREKGGGVRIREELRERTD